ncbi:DUF2637 domain-containing protein [Streptomyces sp. NPDC051642]|uniref:DUF2637 domain-containing protein n=1 Tax=Streptomyces sp. NPDC051642 TaxID=3154646 RepID=UPI0034383ECE
MTHLAAAHSAPAVSERSVAPTLLGVPPSAEGSKRGPTTAQRALIVTGATLVAVVAMAASATTLSDLGRAVGWGEILAWSLPVSVDVLALVAGVAWLAGGAGQALGRVLTLITVGVSVLLNSIGHLVSTRHLEASSYLVIGVSAVPPLAAALAVHLGATVNADRPDALAPRPFDTIEAVPSKRTVMDPGHRSDNTRGPADQADPDPACRGAVGDRRTVPDHPQTTGQPTQSAAPGHRAGTPDQRTGIAAERTDQSADQDGDAPGSGRQGTDRDPQTTDQAGEAAPADHHPDTPVRRTTTSPHHVDRDSGPGPQSADSVERTRKPAGQSADQASPPTDHERTNHSGGPDEETRPAAPDQGGPADQTQVLDHPSASDQDPQTADPAADSVPADQAPAPEHRRTGIAADQPADPDEEGGEGDPTGGPHGARTTGDHDTAPAAHPDPADHDGEVPWEVKVAFARQAALETGQMTRRAITTRLRDHGIAVSNEHFSDIQNHLYADPALAHLPPSPRRPR